MRACAEPSSTAVEELDYDLPADRIALRPAEPRDASRLMIVERGGDRRQHATFQELPDWLRSGDLLVVNDTRVFPARLRGERSGGGEVEMLLIQSDGRDGAGETWTCLARPGRRLRAGARASFEGGISAEWLDGGSAGGVRRVRLWADRPVAEVLEEAGEVPLPPYIDRPVEASDRASYQTVYARERGSVAAPTAGLHFTPELLDRLRAFGVEIRSLTLHVGPGTFLPMRAATAEEHRMLPEHAGISRVLADAVTRARREGRRVIAVGTTTVRALEGAPGNDALEPFQGPVSLFIRPGHRFRRIDALLTNFHLPRSTLLLLVTAFAGRDRVLAAYRDAVERGYRFYSFGDAMLVL